MNMIPRRTVMVTGAAGNLGRAVATSFSAIGTRLVLFDRQADLLRRTFGSDSPDRLILSADLLDRSATVQAVAKAIEEFGRIDILCNLAGGFRMGESVHETSDETWDFLSNINVRTLLNTARAVVPHMIKRGGGSIVNVGSASADHGVAQMGAYCAAKSSVVRLTESMAAELRERNINVNCVLPSIIDTPENRVAMPEAAFDRWVSPQALADVILFLASPAARSVHGAALPVVGLV
jgi:NAD(P)-dependent dehydrogenase (short-subunit alcohol dehydrogenase family)